MRLSLNQWVDRKCMTWKMKEWKMHDMKKVENAHTGK